MEVLSHKETHVKIEIFDAARQRAPSIKRRPSSCAFNRLGDSDRDNGGPLVPEALRQPHPAVHDKMTPGGIAQILDIVNLTLNFSP